MTRDIVFASAYSAAQFAVGPMEFAQRSEEMGFDALWVPDYLLLPRLDAFTMLAAMAARTQRIRIGTAVVVLPYRNPLHWAKTALTLDVLSSGRLMFGVGVGGDYPEEFEALGIKMRQRGRMSDESLDIIRRLFTDSHVTHKGEFYSFEDVTIGPPSVQKPHIPIFVAGEWHGGMADGVLRRTAKYGDGFLPLDIPLQGYREAKQRIEAYAREEGRDLSTFEWALDLWICIAENREKATKIAEEVIEAKVGFTWSVTPDTGIALGTLAECTATIEQFISLGVNHVMINPLCPRDEVMAQYEMMAREVIPYFKNG